VDNAHFIPATLLWLPHSSTLKVILMAEKKIKAIQTAYTKTQTIQSLMDSTGLARKDVVAVLDGLSDIIEGHIKKRSCGQFTLPGLLKIKTVKKPARKAQKNVPNPFRPGETMDVAARPASTVVKVAPLKKLKDMTL
jgi:nucleoid DNA-binding protein